MTGKLFHRIYNKNQLSRFYMVNLFIMVENMFKELLPSRIKYFLLKRLTPKQKNFIKKLVSPKKEAQHRVDNLRYKLLNLGFTDRALAELEYLLASGSKPLKRLAAWELALWYANQYNEVGAKRCLELLP